PVTYGNWSPTNYGDGFYGPITLSEALAKSLNTVAAGVGQEIGEERIISLAKRFGIESQLRPYPSIALGSQEVSLYEITRAYGPFASGGKRLDPYLISKIEDSRGNILYERPEYEPLQVYPEPLAREMTGLLNRVVEDGTGGRTKIDDWTVAGKTGTSQEWRDALFVGFTAEYIAGVWVGNDDDTPTAQVNGGGLPAEIWSAIMTEAHAGKTPKTLVGANTYVPLTNEAESKIAYYRNLANSFRSVVTDE
ncbi:MAG: penicillin-binding transpeptidase domain-containing protein, partial [Pseudomonadota bacterium]